MKLSVCLHSEPSYLMMDHRLFSIFRWTGWISEPPRTSRPQLPWRTLGRLWPLSPSTDQKVRPAASHDHTVAIFVGELSDDVTLSNASRVQLVARCVFDCKNHVCSKTMFNKWFMIKSFSSFWVNFLPLLKLVLYRWLELTVFVLNLCGC